MIVFLFSLFANTIIIKDVEISTVGKFPEVGYQLKMGLLNKKLDRLEIDKYLKTFFQRQDIRDFNYELQPVNDSKIDHVLRLTIFGQTIITKLTLISNYSLDEKTFFQDIGQTVGRPNYYKSDNLLIRRIESYLEQQGLIKDSVDVNYVQNAEGEELIVKIQVSGESKLLQINFTGDLPSKYKKQLSRFINHKWNIIDFDSRFREIGTDLLDDNYLQRVLTRNVVIDENKQVTVDINCDLGKEYRFNFKGNKTFSRRSFIRQIKERITTLYNPMIDTFFVRSIITSAYEETGIYNSNIQVTETVNQEILNYNVDINEGTRTVLERVVIYGDSSARGQELFFSQASELTRQGFYDRKYAQSFVQILKDLLIERGYLQGDVDGPMIVNRGKGIELSYTVREGVKTIVREINIKGIDNLLLDSVVDFLQLTKNDILNVKIYADRIKKLTSFLADKGYVFAKIEDTSGQTINYQNNYRDAYINISIDLGKLARFNTLVLQGNDKTKDYIIIRAFNLKSGEVVTAKILNDFRNKLNALNLFSRVDINHYINEEMDEHYQVDIVVEVDENKFGSIEISPGYRTDLGPKIGVDLSYSNLRGVGNIIDLQMQANQRPGRRDLGPRALDYTDVPFEYLLAIDHIWPFIGGSAVEVQANLSLERRNFYNFDADVQKMGGRISFPISERFAMSLNYQYEMISQYGSVHTEDNGLFRMGGITPSFIYDGLDNQINPKYGHYLSLSSEYVGPSFGAMKNDNIEIEFVKIIGRYKFYHSINRFVLPLSLTIGMEKNLSAKTKIPGIKILRLDGIDMIRGYTSEEANHIQGIDVSDIGIIDKGYLFNFKFSPRYYITDNIGLGTFLDLGKLIVTGANSSLKTAVGLYFSYATPVGLLNIEYGVKLGPKNFNESIGQINFSIGNL